MCVDRHDSSAVFTTEKIVVQALKCKFNLMCRHLMITITQLGSLFHLQGSKNSADCHYNVYLTLEKFSRSEQKSKFFGVLSYFAKHKVSY